MYTFAMGNGRIFFTKYSVIALKLNISISVYKKY
jgi:hypothetical protein